MLPSTGFHISQNSGFICDSNKLSLNAGKLVTIYILAPRVLFEGEFPQRDRLHLIS